MENIEEIIRRIDTGQENKIKNEIKKYLRNWYWFLLSGLLGVALGFLIFKNSPHVFEVKSRLYLQEQNQELNSVLSFNDNTPRNPNVNPNIERKIGLLQSYSLFHEALMNLNWTTSWYKKEWLYTMDMYGREPFELETQPDVVNAENIPLEITALNEREYQLVVKGETTQLGHYQTIDIDQIVPFNEPFRHEAFNFTLKQKSGKPGETYLLIFNSLDGLTREYLNKTNISSENPNSSIITIAIRGTVRQKQADFINELNQVFIQFGIKNRNKSSEKSLEFIDSQLTKVKDSLGLAEARMTNYRRSNQTLNLGQEAQVIFNTLQQVEQEQYVTQMQIDYYRNLLQYLGDAKRIEERVNPSVVGINDANLDGMLTNLNSLYSRREVLLYSVQDQNPSLIMLEKEISLARNALEETLKNQLKATESRMESLQDRFNSIQARLNTLPEIERRLIGNQREFDLNNELYTFLLQKKSEAAISKASIAPEVQVIDPAMPEVARFIGPSLIRNVAAGLVGGMAIPFLAITFISLFSSKIETREEIEKATGIPVLEGIMRHRYKVKLPVIHHPRSGIAESFRGLKTNINTLTEGTNSKVVSVNSLIPGEGKSFISANLAAVFSKTGKKVLLIGGDLHKPTLHQILKVKESFGLSDFLNDEKALDEIILTTSIPGLFFIQTGNNHENPSDLLDGVKFEKLIAHTREQFDYIIIDNAPLILIPDAILTSQVSDISLFILRVNYSHKGQIKQINKIVDFNKIERSAIVMNDIRESGYGYEFGYRKKYWKKGYGEYRYKAGKT